MIEIKGVLAIIFDKKDSETYFLLLHRILNWTGWEFPKGRLEGDEFLEEAVLREAKEETGLKSLQIIKKLDYLQQYLIGEDLRTNDVFLVKGSMNEEIKLQQELPEHDSYKWLPASQVEEYLPFENLKEIFRESLKEIEKIEN